MSSTRLAWNFSQMLAKPAQSVLTVPNRDYFVYGIPQLLCHDNRIYFWSSQHQALDLGSSCL